MSTSQQQKTGLIYQNIYFSLKKKRCCLETRIQPSQTFLLTSIFWKERKKKLQNQMSHDVSLRSNQINQHLPLSFPPLATWKVKPGQSLPVQKIQVLGERSGGQIQEILRCLEQKIKTTLDYPRLSGCLFKYTFS